MDKDIAQKLDILLNIQHIDTKIDNLERLKGELPEDLRNLKDELITLEIKLSNIDLEIKSHKKVISEYKVTIDESEQLIEKYQKQQTGIRNNREFDALTKEIDLQNLEIKLNKKRIKQEKEIIKEKDVLSKKIKNDIQDQKLAIEYKRNELEEVIKENKEIGDTFLKERKKVESQIAPSLLATYNKLRKNLKNKLAIVLIEREACGGCFNIITPQQQLDIKSKNRIMICEHCGRILAGIFEEDQTLEKAG